MKKLIYLSLALGGAIASILYQKSKEIPLWLKISRDNSDVLLFREEPCGAIRLSYGKLYKAINNFETIAKIYDSLEAVRVRDIPIKKEILETLNIEFVKADDSTLNISFFDKYLVYNNQLFALVNASKLYQNLSEALKND